MKDEEKIKLKERRKERFCKMKEGEREEGKRGMEEGYKVREVEIEVEGGMIYLCPPKPLT